MKKSTAILIWGGATGIASVIFYQILYATGMENSGLRWVNLLIIFLGLFIGTMKYRDKVNGGYLTFGEGFLTGFFMSLIVTVFSTIATAVNLQIHPDMMDKILEQSRNNMINKGYTDQQIEMGMKMTKMFTSPAAMILFAIIGGLILGALLSLITGGICTKKKPMFEDANESPVNEIPQA